MKLICIGRNYAEHITELKNEKPTDPVIFLKPDSAILPKKNPFYIPDFSKEIHHEVEVLVKINRPGKYIKNEFADRYYDKIGLGLDFTARDLQDYLKKNGLPWEKSKAFDGSAVIGEFIEIASIKDINNINFHLTKNDEIVQKGNTSLMLWNINEIISYVSQFFTLKIGDIIFTGTPSGVGKVKINDKLVGFLDDKKMFEITIK